MLECKKISAYSDVGGDDDDVDNDVDGYQDDYSVSIVAQD